MWTKVGPYCSILPQTNGFLWPPKTPFHSSYLNKNGIRAELAPIQSLQCHAVYDVDCPETILRVLIKLIMRDFAALRV